MRDFWLEIGIAAAILGVGLTASSPWVGVLAVFGALVILGFAYEIARTEWP